MDGIISVLKPPAMSSSDVVVDIRRLFCQKRVGHTGTLDPGAAGVLPICIGRATRLFDYLVDKKKRYIFEIHFGTSTDTQDAYGKRIDTACCDVSRAELEAVLPLFTGKQKQTAPMYSALKSGGRKLYDIALAGDEIPDKIRELEIYELKILDKTEKNRFLLEAECSKGTYIRTLCRDIGQRLGLPAHMSFLLRSASGAFTIEGAHTIAELGKMKERGQLESAVVSCEAALVGLDRVDLPKGRTEPMKNGLVTKVLGMADGAVRCYCGDVFMGVAKIQSEQIKLAVHLY
ncbi:MAG: tRNA pseudouridine(55) synthase TruB [Clostridia bacterium]|nr:tRNA pseudouridine(55) synthase TruB [Clostridia bacterium]